MADEKVKNADNAVTDDKGKDDIDKQIEMERKRQEALRSKGTPDDAQKPDEKKDTADKKSDDPDRITVDRDYISKLRDEAKQSRLALEESQKVSQSLGGLLQKFDVKTIDELNKKLEDTKRAKEQEEETKLSRVEIAEKRAQKLEKEFEEWRIKTEQEKSDLIKSRDDMIIKHALIQAAVAKDVENPKQLLRLLKDEFRVDPVRLVPLYKYADSGAGEISLEERVAVFLNEPENWNLVRSKIKEGSGSTGSTGSIGGKKIFTKDELSKMRRENPDEYKRLQPEILKAYAEKRVK